MSIHVSYRSIDDTDTIVLTDDCFRANDIPGPLLTFLHDREEVFLGVIEVLLERHQSGSGLVGRGRYGLEVHLAAVSFQRTLTSRWQRLLTL